MQHICSHYNAVCKSPCTFMQPFSSPPFVITAPPPFVMFCDVLSCTAESHNSICPPLGRLLPNFLYLALYLPFCHILSGILLESCVTHIPALYLAHLLTFHLAFYLIYAATLRVLPSFRQSVSYLFRHFSGIDFDVLSDILSGMCFFDASVTLTGISC